jgi:hypothetical protein
LLTKKSRALGVIEATIDETEETETGTEIEIVVTGETEESVATVEIVESVEGRDHHISAHRAVKARSIPTPPAATTEQENEKTDTEAMVEGMIESGTVTEATEAHLEETSGEI